MTDPDTFVARVRACLTRRQGFEEKRMFGGVGFLLNGNMCCGVHKGRLILRLGPEAGPAALEEPNVQPFDITGRPMRGWVMIHETYLPNDADLKQWITLAIDFARTLPPK